MQNRAMSKMSSEKKSKEKTTSEPLQPDSSPVNRNYEDKTPAEVFPNTVFFYSHTVEEYRIFSQWYLSNFTDPDTNITFNCCEQWMMWNKAKMFGDEQAAAAVLATKQPKQQKALGRKVRNFDAAQWDAEKMRIVTRGNYLKFTIEDSTAGDNKCTRKPSDLGLRLMRTGSEDIVEASPSDKIWGIGLKAEQARNMNPAKWPGQNLLGKALMRVRVTLQMESEQGKDHSLLDA